MRITRRTFLGGSLVVLAAGCRDGDGDDGAGGPTTSATSGATTSTTALEIPPLDVAGDPFTLGVASGDPALDSVILWTRLLPDGGEVPGGAELAWQIARDPGFDDVVAGGTVPVDAALGHTVHVEAGGLEPATTYWYRFLGGEHTSPVGRTRTVPAPGDEPGELRFVVASCQNFITGHYAAHRHLAAEEADLVLWLGDYIYERAERPRREDEVREHVGPEPSTLDEYRQRYALYKRDADLQAAHAASPWAVTWDDHEVVNNYAGSAGDAGTADDFRARRAAAYQAWYEHQPVRLPPPDGADYRIHRTIDAGALARFVLLDGRQYRDDQPCGVDGDLGEPCAEIEEPGRTMLGSEQEAWLTEQLGSATATWTVLGNQTVLSPARFELGPLRFANLDQWDGYAAARQRLLDDLAGAPNPVVVTGDIHASGVADVRAEAGDRSTPIVATELVGAPISSTFPDEYAGIFEAAVGAVPDVHYVNTRQRGYLLCTLTPERLTADYRLLADARDPGSEIATGATFTVDAGTPGAHRVGG